MYTYYHTDGSAGYKPVVMEFNHAIFADTRGTKVPYIAVTCNGERVLALVRRIVKEQMPGMVVEMNKEFGKNTVLMYLGRARISGNVLQCNSIWVFSRKNTRKVNKVWTRKL